MSKRWSTMLAVASLSTVPLIAAPVPVRVAAESPIKAYDVSNRSEQQAELHRSLVARESAKGLSPARSR